MYVHIYLHESERLSAIQTKPLFLGEELKDFGTHRLEDAVFYWCSI